ncbi:hypothetical protein LPA44_08570 [Halobacterium sp. KA-4]|uniref:hypothetical protein n=1 Tax=Halobacterium sp. KA-4 TaxID=2896367 RepID=UPI001E625E9A|nr:hypothetical protein [Halobacterium sp. KA-4]MCD2199948.1 hypothetical protein [Halobacterium sp. KA-4]
MSDSEDLTEADIRDVVREELSKAARSMLSTVVWTVLAVLGVLVGLQSIQVAFYSLGMAALGFALFGVVVTASSVYLLYILHAK